MKLHHVAVVATSEEKSDRFYSGLLGLEKQRKREIPASLMNAIFQINRDTVMINYGNDALLVEVFIAAPSEARTVSHLCLEAPDRETLLETCEQMNIAVLRVPKDDGGYIAFIDDFDGNRFEIK
ncbi:MAG: VOC family protein [Thermodesulfobacteriota bacterium]|nr:VOC family protein [Thermodesulfobacteriota bacterium]